MPLKDMNFDPSTGLLDENVFPSKPLNPREQFMTLFNQLKDSINNDVIGVLKSAEDGDSGADNVKATAISGITGGTVQAILESLKSIIFAEGTGDKTLGNSGYYKLPGGLILEWGRTTVASGGSTNFPLSFPNGCYVCLPIPNNITLTSFTPNVTSNGSFLIYHSAGATTAAFFFIALGS